MFSDILVELGYMGSKGIHEVYYSQGNQALLDANPASPTPILSRRLFPLWGSGMRTAGGDGVTSYEGGYVKLEKRFASGLSFLAHYSLGKALDYSSQVNETTRNFFDPRMGKGRSLFDVRNRIVFSATYELPVGPGKRFLAFEAGSRPSPGKLADQHHYHAAERFSLWRDGQRGRVQLRGVGPDGHAGGRPNQRVHAKPAQVVQHGGVRNTGERNVGNERAQHSLGALAGFRGCLPF